MPATSARLLRLLSLLQAHQGWTGPRLADRLRVTTRTVRRDVERLRELGYPVDAAPGTTGGYRLGAGAELPPLLLDDDEAVAVVVGLRTATGGGVEGLGESSVRALAKLEQVLPGRLRRRVGALHAYTVPLLRAPGGPGVEPGVLTELAAVCRDGERLRFAYRDHAGAGSRRTVEPHRLVCTEHRWYLVAWDLDREDWRTFRADRITPRPPHGPRFTPREGPAEDLAAYVSEGLSTRVYPDRVVLRLLVPVEEAARRVSPSDGTLTAESGRSCLLTAGATGLDVLVIHILLLGLEFEVVEGPGVEERLRAAHGLLGRALERGGRTGEESAAAFPEREWRRSVNSPSAASSACAAGVPEGGMRGGPGIGMGNSKRQANNPP
ncbi:YafY family transcriptional regulator [Streptomyces gougerotii]|nr:YafY family transcriptional regulator [Streptomyces gougerotii]